MSNKRMILSATFWLAIIINSSAASVANGGDSKSNCCNNGTNLLINRKCYHNQEHRYSDMKLNCLKDRFLIDPTEYEDDAYNITANGTLHMYQANLFIQPGEFCLANFYDNDTDETRFIAVACFPPLPLAMEASVFMIKGILIFVSVAFLLLTLYIYYLLPELRETQDKVTIFTIACLTIFLFHLGILQLATHEFIDSCVPVGFVVYFFSMAYFAWLNCVMANVWKHVVLRQWKINESTWHILNHIYAWSIPVGLLILVGALHSIEPSIGKNSCWFDKASEQWTLVYLPISLMLALNVLFCISTAFTLHSKGEDISPDRRKELEYKCMLYLKLFLLGGITWILEVLSYTFSAEIKNSYFWAGIDFFNCLHGVLTFFILIVWRRRIRKELAGKKILCFRAPESWSNVESDEQDLKSDDDKGKYDLIVK